MGNNKSYGLVKQRGATPQPLKGGDKMLSGLSFLCVNVILIKILTSSERIDKYFLTALFFTFLGNILLFKLDILILLNIGISWVNFLIGVDKV